MSLPLLLLLPVTVPLLPIADWLLLPLRLLKLLHSCR